MKQSSYREQDYAFGQMVLNLRSNMKLTQAALAELLGVSRQSVVEWEAGSKYPKVTHLQALVALAVQNRAFPAGREVDEIQALWKSSRQKVLLDEGWLARLLAVQNGQQSQAVAPALAKGTQFHWDDAIAVDAFYGREAELTLLTQWILEERCRVVSVLGMGGIGKSALTVHLMQQYAEHFEVVIWRSLRDIPSCDALLDSLLEVFAPRALIDPDLSMERRQSVLLDFMRRTRALLVFDNLESLLEDGESAGHLRPGYEGFGRFLRLSAETSHQSCVLITSREKPNELVSPEGSRSPVRALRLGQLETDACERLLAEKDVAGSAAERSQLIDAYTGNPLALKIVTQTIIDLFDGQIAPFLEQGEVIFGGVRELLSEQFTRLSPLAQSLLLWLAIMREPLMLDELARMLVTPIKRDRLLEAVDSLHRRSLIERGVQPGSFTLHSVVLEYLTALLIAEVSDEIQAGRLSRLIEFGLGLGQAREYVRQTQERLIVAPILEYLVSVYTHHETLESQLLGMLAQLTTWAENLQGYGSANLLTFLRLHRGHLRGLDLSGLKLRNAYLQAVDMQDTSLSRTLVQETVFSETFDAVLSTDVSKSGEQWAASSRRGEVLVWNAEGVALQSAWRAHSDMIWSIKFSPDGQTLATASWDCTVKVWETATGTLRWSGKHKAHVNSVAFSPNGRYLASGSNDATVALWDSHTGAQLQTLQHPVAVSGCTVNWSPDGRMLVTGDQEGSIRLWEIPEGRPAQCLQVFAGHSTFVDALAFSPDGQILASTSFDGTVKLWDMIGGQLQLRQAVVGHVARIGRFAWSPDGLTLACGGIDKMIWLVDIPEGRYRAALQGHAHGVTGLAFMPDGHSLLSCGDYTLHLWDIDNRYCTRVIEGYSKFLYAVDWSPDGRHLVGGGMDTVVALWDLGDDDHSPQIPPGHSDDDRSPRTLHGHTGAVCGVAWSPDGQWLASSEWDNVIRLWNPISGTCVRIIQYPDDPDNFFYDLAWSPDGQRLAIGTSEHGVQIFELPSYHQPWVKNEFPTWIRHIAWSPDGTLLAGAGDDGVVYVWEATDGTLRHQLKAHHSMVVSLAWSPDGTQLASGSRGVDGGELFIWDVQNDYRLRVFENHPGVVYAIAWGADEKILISGDDDGTLRWWSVESGACLLVHQAHRGAIEALRRSPDGTTLASCADDGAIMLWSLSSGDYLRTLRRDRPYERLDITGIRGLTEAQKANLRALGAVEITG